MHRLYSECVHRKLLTASLIGFALLLSGCAVTTPTTDNGDYQTFDPADIPTTAPTDALAVDPAVFANEYQEYSFKVGGGPTWCTINGNDHYVVCEQNEADATYDELPAPDACKLSFGYQFKLFETKPKGNDAAQIACASGLYADPATAQTLNTGETLTVGDITCFVTDITARCDNKHENFIVLGPEVWAKG
ncbi:MAG: hypothetical protein RLZZ56_1032 [Actinomycetota bacterium]